MQQTQTIEVALKALHDYKNELEQLISGDYKQTVKEDEIVRITGDQLFKIGGDKRERIEKDYHLRVLGDKKEDVEGNKKFSINGNALIEYKGDYFHASIGKVNNKFTLGADNNMYVGAKSDVFLGVKSTISYSIRSFELVGGSLYKINKVKEHKLFRSKKTKQLQWEETAKIARSNYNTHSITAGAVNMGSKKLTVTTKVKTDISTKMLKIKSTTTATLNGKTIKVG